MLSLKALEFSSLIFLEAGGIVETEMELVACLQGAPSASDLSIQPMQILVCCGIASAQFSFLMVKYHTRAISNASRLSLWSV